MNMQKQYDGVQYMQYSTSSAQNGVLLWTCVRQITEAKYCFRRFYSPPTAMWDTFYDELIRFIRLLLDYWKITPFTAIMSLEEQGHLKNSYTTLIGFIWKLPSFFLFLG